MCCAIGALVIAVMAAWRRLLKAASGWHSASRRAAAIAVALGLGAGTATAAQHFQHYGERAENHRRTILAEIWSQPICDGNSIGRQSKQQISRLN